MEHIAIYLNNKKKIDLDTNTLFNPGVGGTEYMFVLQYFLLKEKFNITFFSTNEISMDHVNISIMVNDISEAIDKTDCDAKVFIARDLDLLSSPKKIQLTSFKYIAWAHNYQSYDMMEFIANCPNIVRNICVGREQYELLRGHRIFLKSDYIFNCIPVDSYDVFTEKKENIVCFVGNLSPNKGFDILAKAWKKVVKKVPSAQLYVIGSGKLYDDNIKLGRLNLAEEKFENKFMKSLTINGDLMPSVHFLGLLKNKQKNVVMGKAKVAVVNPAGWHETFCLCATEFEALGVPIVTYNGYGYLDTVSNKTTGLLFSKRSQLSKFIVELLINDELNNQMSINSIQFVKKKFNLESISSKWESTINAVISNIKVTPDYNYQNKKSFRKFSLDLYRIFKRIIPFLPYPYNRNLKNKIKFFKKR